MAAIPNPTKAQLEIHFETLHRLATNTTHRYLYKCGEEEEGTISTHLFEIDPMTGAFVRIAGLLNQFAQWEPQGMLNAVANATPEAMAEVKAYSDEIENKLNRDGPSLIAMTGNETTDRAAPGPEIFTEAEVAGVDTAMSLSELEDTYQEELNSSDVESESSLLGTPLEQDETDPSRLHVHPSRSKTILRGLISIGDNLRKVRSKKVMNRRGRMPKYTKLR